MMDKIDFKKIYKDFYMPKQTPSIVSVPAFNYIAVRGKGNPNDENGEYAQALQLLYSIAYTIKMSKMGDHKFNGYYKYVMPALEGLWWIPGKIDIDLHEKSEFHLVSMIAQPDFVNTDIFQWACKEVQRKKGLDTSKADLITLDEGLCVTCMHIGAYDDEVKTIKRMHHYAEEAGYVIDINEERRHHEIYLRDPRKTEAANLKTVIRLPIRRKK